MNEWLTSKEFAAELKVSTRTLSTWRKRGLVIPAGFTPGGHPRYHIDQVAEVLAARGRAATTSRVVRVDQVLSASKARADARRRGA